MTAPNPADCVAKRGSSTILVLAWELKHVKTLYFDCFSGISGDMTIGALLDLGVDFDYLKTEVGKLPLAEFDAGFDLRVSSVLRAKIKATKFDVVVAGESHHAHGPAHHDHSDAHRQGPEHAHSHEHSDDPGGGHFHRKASDIIRMIQKSGLSSPVRERAVAIFEKLAVSEGQVHDIRPEDVEFHEVGAIDSIVDVVGTAIGLDALEVERFMCSPINIGGGFIHCQHGVYPVPAPATANLLTHAPVYSKHVDAELVTPTGAAILAATIDEFGPMDGFQIESIGYGAGTKSFAAFPNCLRLFLGTVVPPNQTVSKDAVVVIEANIDDMSAEALAYAGEKLLASGALDVVTIPVVMKKGRPGYLLQVLAAPGAEQMLSRTMFEETTTIGLRMRPMSRRVLDRETVAVETPHGKVALKVSRFEGRVVNVSPEYDDCARLARETGRPFHQIRDDAIKSYETVKTNR